MKKLIVPISLLLIILFIGCIKNTPATNSDSKVEFDAATWFSNSVGVTYPIIAGVPNFGNNTLAANLGRTSPTFQVRVNLLGPQRSTATVFNYTVVPVETTAIAGTHYATLSGVGTIPANSSYGYIDIKPLDPGVSSTTPVTLVLELQTNNSVTANVNYAKIGLSISQL